MNERVKILQRQLKALDTKTPATPSTRVRLLNDLSWELRHTDMGQAYRLGDEARTLLEHHPQPRQAAKCHTLLAELCMHRGDFHKAARFSRRAKYLAETEALDYLRPFALSTQGCAHWLLGDLPEALSYFKTQHHLSRQLGDETNEAEALNNIALIHLEYGDFDSSDRTMGEALRLYETLNDRAGQALVLNNLAMNQVEAGTLQEAMPLAQQALDLARTTGHQPYLLCILDTIGLIYLHQGQYALADAYFKKTIALAEAVEAGGDKAVSLMRLGQLQARRRDKTKALAYLRGALQVLEASSQKKALSECHHSLSELYERQGDLTRAIHHYKQFHSTRESLFYDRTQRKGQQLVLLHASDAPPQEAGTSTRFSRLPPICSYCKEIRDENGDWHQLEAFLFEHSGIRFSHGICTACMQRVHPEISINDGESDLGQ